MKKIGLILVLLMMSFCYSQGNKEDNQIYDMSQVDVRPEYKGGMSQFYDFVDKNFVIPAKEGLKGKVYVEFIVEKNGLLSNLKIIKDIGYGTDLEALRILQKSPKWNVGLKNGQPVRTKYLLPIILNDWK